MADPLSYFSFHPVFHEWFNKGRGMYYPVCGMAACMLTKSCVAVVLENLQEVQLLSPDTMVFNLHANFHWTKLLPCDDNVNSCFFF